MRRISDDENKKIITKKASKMARYFFSENNRKHNVCLNFSNGKYIKIEIFLVEKFLEFIMNMREIIKKQRLWANEIFETNLKYLNAFLLSLVMLYVV